MLYKLSYQIPSTQTRTHHTHSVGGGAFSWSVGVRTYLFAIVSDGLQDGAECFEAHGHVDEVRGKEEVVDVAEARHHEVPPNVQE